MNIPNALTLLRIILIPVFVIVFYLPFKWNHLLACLIFSLAAVTDILDGYLARRLKQTSSLGAFLDPVADKLMVAVVLVLLVQRDPRIIMALPAAVIIGREITISALREWMAELGARSKVAVSIYGKIKTITQMVAIFLVLIRFPFSYYFLLAAVILTVISAIDYLAKLWPYLLEGKSPKQRGK